MAMHSYIEAMFSWSREHFWPLAIWIPLLLGVSIFAGASSAFFLWSLDFVTHLRMENTWIVAFLPIAGFFVGWVYWRFGQGGIEGGNNTILNEIHSPKEPISWWMMPFVLFGTLISHLFGASVGREGTALQMSASLSDQLSKPFHLNENQRKSLLMASLAGGFSAVFGTPWAGAFFAMEVLRVGRLHWQSFLYVTLASFGANEVALYLGAQHTGYSAGLVPNFHLSLLGVVVLAALSFGLLARSFSIATRWIGAQAKRISYAPLRPAIGGGILAIFILALGLERYSGLGIPVIQEAFTHPLAWVDTFAKWAMTVFSLGMGFKGGEVTPLFHLGATLGNSIGVLMGEPYAWIAALGFVGVFAGASNTPIASTFLAVEIFGLPIAPYALLANLIATVVSGYPGIYKSQKPFR